MANEFTARVAGISVELGMSVQNKSGINRLLMRFVITLRKPSQRWSNTYRGGGEYLSSLLNWR